MPKPIPADRKSQTTGTVTRICYLWGSVSTGIVEVDTVSASHRLRCSGKPPRAYQSAFVRAHVPNQSEERFNAGDIDRARVILAV
jgi:hypothetical protein